jgi:hypothetical protein
MCSAFGFIFDVLIANNRFSPEIQSGLRTFCQTTRNINHTLLYGAHPGTLSMTSFTVARTLITHTITAPDDELIAQFMFSIDPPSPWQSLHDLPWIKEQTGQSLG